MLTHAQGETLGVLSFVATWLDITLLVPLDAVDQLIHGAGQRTARTMTPESRVTETRTPRAAAIARSHDAHLFAPARPRQNTSLNVARRRSRPLAW